MFMFLARSEDMSGIPPHVHYDPQQHPIRLDPEWRILVATGQRSVVSGQWSVVSGQWSVVSCQWRTKSLPSPLKGRGAGGEGLCVFPVNERSPSLIAATTALLSRDNGVRDPRQRRR